MIIIVIITNFLIKNAIELEIVFFNRKGLF